MPIYPGLRTRDSPCHSKISSVNSNFCSRLYNLEKIIKYDSPSSDNGSV